MRHLVALTALLFGVGCSDDGVSLLVELKTDLVPEVEFETVRTELSNELPDVGGAAAEVRAREVVVSTSDAVQDGLRIAEYGGIPAGARRVVRVRLFDADGAAVAERTVRVTVHDTLAVVVLITRDCRGVTCPGDGDDPLATSCLGGRCVNPDCSSEDGTTCGDGECATGADCPAMAACAAAACVEQSCFYEEVDEACGAGQACVAETGCVLTCLPSAEICNGRDDDCDGIADDGFELDTDVANCGACGNACESDNGTASCESGACAVTCDPAFGDCNGDPLDGCETDVGTASHCGSCGTRCDGSTPVCAADSTSDPPAFRCESACGGATPTSCGTSCVDTTRDIRHCGGCGVACTVAHGTPSCTAGVCGIASCDTGWADCHDGTDGCETNVLTSVSACGACGVTCGTSETCVNGSCTCASEAGPVGAGRVCGAGETCCTTGCQRLDADTSNCGACGVSCGPSETCNGGSCVCAAEVGTAGAGPACPGETCCPATGCTNLGTDASNCGACGVACGASETCRSSRCECVDEVGTAGGGPACAAGLTCCAPLGCADLTDDPGNCGACGVACGMEETCGGGACTCGVDRGAVGGGPACVGTERCCPGDSCQPKLVVCPPGT